MKLTAAALIIISLAVFPLAASVSGIEREELFFVSATQDQERPDIEWFKDQMRISSKYTEGESEIMGISWIHFFIMAFLVLFFIMALAALILRYGRTKELIKIILAESSKDGKDLK
ncbi:MAG: hypothetical protein M0P57_08305 [Syntrophales bacterium]|jgi:hypothetical protein|nr:hypothetical protein [Syntrophales bacterium]MDY0043731.1 hypothetical protein [Syntrophales bacterium]